MNQPKSELEIALDDKEQIILRELEYMRDPNTKEQILTLVRLHHRSILEKRGMKHLNDGVKWFEQLTK